MVVSNVKGHFSWESKTIKSLRTSSLVHLSFLLIAHRNLREKNYLTYCHWGKGKKRKEYRSFLFISIIEAWRLFLRISGTDGGRVLNSGNRNLLMSFSSTYKIVSMNEHITSDITPKVWAHVFIYLRNTDARP